MRESVTYQAIPEGEAIGRAQEARRLILAMRERRFGPASEAVRAALAQIDDPERLQAVGLRLLDVAGWDELLEPG